MKKLKTRLKGLERLQKKLRNLDNMQQLHTTRLVVKVKRIQKKRMIFIDKIIMIIGAYNQFEKGFRKQFKKANKIKYFIIYNFFFN